MAAGDVATGQRGVSHPGAALVVGPVPIAAPYALARALANRAARLFLRDERGRRPGKAWFTYFRIYGPQPAFDGSWKLKDLEPVR